MLILPIPMLKIPINSSLKRSFSGPTSTNASAFTVLKQNIKGFSACKGELHATLCVESQCHVLCLQETHRDETNVRPRIPGMNLINEVLNVFYESTVFARSGLVLDSAAFGHIIALKS